MPAKITVPGGKTGRVLPHSDFHLIRSAFAFLLFACVLVTQLPLHAQEVDTSAEIGAEIRSTLSQAYKGQTTEGKHPKVLQAFYAQRNYAPVWLDAKRLMELQMLARLAALHGLNPQTYALPQISQMISETRVGQSYAELAEFDVLASAAVVKLAVHLRDGSVDLARRRAAIPREGQLLWDAADGLLATAAASESLFAYLNGLAPDTVVYRALQASLFEYRDLLNRNVSWAKVPAGRTLEPGMIDPRVALLRKRLGASSPGSPLADSSFYDENLAIAVADFQERHLLAGDALVGRRTIEALNVPISDRLDQILVNLEWQRWAAMPEYDEYLLVNVAHFKIHWVNNGERTWTTKTQVGRYKRQTPVFKSELTKVVANPSWTVPPGIFRKDILPEVQADPDYLERNHMRVVDSAGKTVESKQFDWQQVTAADFPYRLRAKPGKGNALGQLKFEMPNPYLIYLHDTPSRKLFDNDIRTFSSGCIRLEHPDQLARLLMQSQIDRTSARLSKAMEGQRTRHIELDQPIPIVVMYGTIDVDQSGNLVFARDVYRRDHVVLTAMNAAQPDERDTIMLASIDSDAAK